MFLPFISYFKDLFIFYMCISILPSLVYVCCVHSSQKKVLGPLELELQVVVNYHMGDGNLTQVCFKINHCWSLQPRLLKVVIRYLFILKADIGSFKR